METVKLLKSREQEFQLLEKGIRRKAVDGSALKILEAGCGRRWPLNLDGIEYVLTGVDIDKDALEIRKNQINDLNEIIHGDLRYIDLGGSSYDVIYNSFVLEHIGNAERVLDNFRRWLKPGGLLILRIPDRNSVWGFVARVTPFQVHVLFRKYVKPFQNAGNSAFIPYPTVYDPIVSRTGIHEYCGRNSLMIREEYARGFYLEGRGTIAILTRLLVRMLSLLSFGKIEWRYNNLTYLIEKNQQD